MTLTNRQGKFKRVNKHIAAGVLLASVSMTAQSASIAGTITRTLSDGQNYGGCMIQLSKEIGSGCSANWVSLDCKGGYSSAGERNYASALMAFSLNKSVSVYFDPTKTYNTYCVVTRVDVLQ